ncbi:CaiF/GrlA family transcriptional regulator [Aeromonas salmonicida]|uniref:CaiF/GrlA family transcriptional regulator n=1 Tax=Aeromonas salmonicida TaxID=645 RepID=UPI003521C10C
MNVTNRHNDRARQMNPQLLPRYLRIAHWIHMQQRFFSSEDISQQFNIPVRRVSDDFALMRRRTDIITLEEVREWRNGTWRRLIKVMIIHAYQLDARQCPRRIGAEGFDKSKHIANTWRMLLSASWESRRN